MWKGESVGQGEAPALFKTNTSKKKKVMLPPFQEGTMQMLNSRKGNRTVNPQLTEVLPCQPVLDAQKGRKFKAPHFALASIATDAGIGIRSHPQFQTLSQLPKSPETRC